jgi:hypothetical protein
MPSGPSGSDKVNIAPIAAEYDLAGIVNVEVAQEKTVADNSTEEASDLANGLINNADD